MLLQHRAIQPNTVHDHGYLQIMRFVVIGKEITFAQNIIGIRDISVGIAMGYELDGRGSVFSSAQHPD
jgi:hypothetical protein